MWRRREKLDQQVLGYMMRDRFGSNSPREIVGDSVFEGPKDVEKVSKACIRLHLAGLISRKRHTNPTQSRYRVLTDQFDSIIRRIQNPPV